MVVIFKEDKEDVTDTSVGDVAELDNNSVEI